MKVALLITLLLVFVSVAFGNCPTSLAQSKLLEGQGLYSNDYGVYQSTTLISDDCRFYLVIMDNGDLKLFDDSIQSPSGPYLWTNKPHATVAGQKYFVMQGDGNLVIYGANNAVVWSSNTGGVGVSPHYLNVQSDGNVVIYDAHGTATWNTGTGGR